MPRTAKPHGTLIKGSDSTAPSFELMQLSLDETTSLPVGALEEEDGSHVLPSSRNGVIVGGVRGLRLGLCGKDSSSIPLHRPSPAR